MTTAADDAAVEDAFEAYLARRPVPGAAADTFPGLVAFSEAVRATATQPGRPNAALAELLVTGLLTDQPSPSTATARSAGKPPARRPTRVRIRRRTAMFFPALFAKLLSAGAAAQACAGAGVALVAFTGAGAAGVLPGPVQNTVSSVVETVTPFRMPSGEKSVADEPATEESALEQPEPGQPVVEPSVVEQPETEQHVGGTRAEFDAAVWAAEGPDAYPSFGDWVSDGASHRAFKDERGRFGQIVSAQARNKGLDDGDLEDEGVDLDELRGDASTEPTPRVKPETLDADDDDAATKHGDGDGDGYGRGDGHGQGSGRETGGSQDNRHGGGKGDGHN
ncbi:MAG: hypothetical protein JWQ45_2087 [Blastococcus sp.]|nr:hypothetical protein [Blastococcus sp.]